MRATKKFYRKGKVLTVTSAPDLLDNILQEEPEPSFDRFVIPWKDAPKKKLSTLKKRK
tara:strand:+ start:577 stop:750 length:174 start_codon:yes stop_codon:yes gene_type:complete